MFSLSLEKRIFKNILSLNTKNNLLFENRPRKCEEVSESLEALSADLDSILPYSTRCWYGSQKVTLSDPAGVATRKEKHEIISDTNDLGSRCAVK